MTHRRQRTRDRLGVLTQYHVLQLACGFDFFDLAFGDDLDAMRRAWSMPEVRAQVYAMDHSHRPEQKPWAALTFGD